MKKKKSNGMILITTMLFITIIVMIATLIAVQGKSALQNGNLSLQSEEAYLAALSGIEYVRGELRKNKNFGVSNLPESSPNIPTSAVNNLFVNYDGKNLTGYLGYNSTNDYKSKFSVSFGNPNQTNNANGNYQHTSSDCKYLSVNNLNKANPTPKNISNGIRRNVPAYSMYIVSKGVCGKCVRYAETFLTSDSSPSIDGGTTIGGEIKLNGTDGNYSQGTASKNYTDRNSLLSVKHVNKNAIGKLTAFNHNGEANNNIFLQSKTSSNDIYDFLNLTTPVQFNGVVNGQTSFPKPNNNTYLEGLWSKITLNQGTTVDTADLQKLTYDEAKKLVGATTNNEENGTNNSNNNTNSYTLASGTYAYIRDPNRDDGGPEAYWKFINTTNLVTALTNLDNNSASVSNINSTIATGGISFGLHNSNVFFNMDAPPESRTVNLFGNVHSIGTLNFIMVEKINSNTHKLLNSSVDFSVNGGSLISDGDININGEVVGHGNLISNGDISFNAGSELEVDENQKVAVWARGDINIKQATNVSNDRSIELITPTNENGESEELSQNELSEIVTGKIGDVVREEVGFVPDNLVFLAGDDIITDNDGALTNYFCQFTYNQSNYEFRYKQTSQVSGDKPVLVVLKDNTEVKNVWDNGFNNGNSIYSDANIYVSVRMPEGGDEDYSDFNIFLKSNGYYYYYKTIDIGNQNLVITDPNYVGVLPNEVATANRNKKYKTDIDSLTIQSNQNYYVNNTNSDDSLLDSLSTSSTNLLLDILVKNTSLRGTVYSATGKIDIDAGNKNFSILGALVTTKGDLNIKAAHINLTYDPNYVPFFRDANGGIETIVGFTSSFIGGE